MQSGLLLRFFERVTRRTFGDLALDDAPAASYVTDLLARFARAEALATPAGLPPRRLESIVDSLLEIQRAWESPAPDFDPSRERILRRHIGDYALFMSGIFRDHVERLAVTAYYQREGQRAYRLVSELARASGEAEAPLFGRLAEGFERYAGALAYMERVYLRGAELPWRVIDARRPWGRLLTG